MKKTDPGGNEIIYQYDKENNIIRTDRKEITRDRVTNDIVSSRHFAETSIYDQLNRVTEKTNNLGNKVKYFYDSRNNIVKIIDPLDNATEIQYDLFNRLIETRQYLHQYIAGEREEPVNTRYTHNQFDFRTQQTDALGRATQFIYDSSGRQISSVLPDESADLISYDRMGNVILYKNRLGLQKIFNYDELNRNIELQVDTSTLADGEEIFGTINFKTMYDGAGRVLKLENDNIITEFIYNSIGWNLEERTSFKPLEGITFPPAVSIKRQFNNSSSQVGLIYPSNRKIEYVRDILERIIAIRQTQKGNAYPGNNASSENYTIAEIEYEGLQRKKIIRANNTTTEYKYDFGARVIEINHAINNNSFLNLQFLYDALGSMKLQVEAADDFETTQFYKHDSLGRLTKATATDIAETINLSILPASQLPIPEPIPYYQGQINALLPDGTLPEQRNYTYDKVENRERALLNGIENTYLLNKLDQYEIINTDSFDYNKNGNLKQNAGFTYSYNHLNQLSKFKKTGGNEVSFLYDALGRFCARLENGETSAMVYDGHNLLEEYENSLLKSSVVSNSGQDNLLVNSKDGNELYFYPDLNKSVRYLFNGEAKFNFYQYDDFGNILNSLITNDENQFRFGGKRFLSEVNKYDFIYRTYDPVIGRFIQRDPKGFVDGTNIYAFVRNNPLSMTDPFGTQSRDEVKDGNSGQQLWSCYL